MTCKVCGCTDERPCPGGCAWVGPELCSSCALPANDLEAMQAMTPLLQEVVRMQLPGVEAFAVLAALQLAVRHQGMGESARQIVTVVARALQERLSLTPALAALCEAGWHPVHDVASESRIITPG